MANPQLAWLLTPAPVLTGYSAFGSVTVAANGADCKSAVLTDFGGASPSTTTNGLALKAQAE